MKNFKKIIAAALALIMVLALTPATLAEDAAIGVGSNSPSTNFNVVTIGNGGDYATYSAAITAIGCDNLDGYYFKQVSDITDGPIRLNEFTKSATVVFDGQGFDFNLQNAFIVMAKNNTSTIDVTLKNINADTSTTHPLVYARTGAVVTVDNCSTTEKFAYSFAFGGHSDTEGSSYIAGKIIVNSGSYHSSVAMFRNNYLSEKPIEIIINGGNFEMISGGLFNNDAHHANFKVGQINHYTTIAVNGGTFVASDEVMFNCLGGYDIDIAGGTFIVEDNDSDANGETMFNISNKGDPVTTTIDIDNATFILESVGGYMFNNCYETSLSHGSSDYTANISDSKFYLKGNASGEVMFCAGRQSNNTAAIDVTIDSCLFYADGAIMTYLNKGTAFDIDNSIFYQNVAFPVFFERTGGEYTIDVAESIFYTPDYSALDALGNGHKMTLFDGTHDMTNSSNGWSVAVDADTKFYYSVTEPMSAANATPKLNNANTVESLTHGTMCGKGIAITPTAVAANVSKAELMLADGYNIPVNIDADLNSPVYEGAIIYLTEDYAGEELEITQKVTIETNGFDAGDLKAGENACIRNGIVGMDMYVQYTTPDYFGQFSARIVFSVSSVDYMNFGMLLTANKDGKMNDGKTGALAKGVSNIYIKNCYKSINAGGEVITAEELGGRYLIAVEITDLNASHRGKPLYLNVYAMDFEGNFTETGVKTLNIPAVIG